MEQIFVGHIIKSIEISLSESVMESWWNQHLVIDKMCCNKTIMEALIKNINESNHLENEHYLVFTTLPIVWWRDAGIKFLWLL